MTGPGYTQQELDAEVARILGIYGEETLRFAAAARSIDVPEGATIEQVARLVVTYDFEKRTAG